MNPQANRPYWNYIAFFFIAFFLLLADTGYAQSRLKMARASRKRSKPMKCVHIGKQKVKPGKSLFKPGDPLLTKRSQQINTNEKEENKKETTDKEKTNDRIAENKPGQPSTPTGQEPGQPTLVTGGGSTTDQTTEKKEDKPGTPPEQVKTTPRKPFLNPLYFTFDQDQLTEEDMNTLRTAAAFLQYGYVISLEGHTDNKGTHEYNTTLSMKRVEKIKEIMVSEIGVPAEKILLKAFGETRPAIHNDTPISRQLNRRVEVRIVDRRK